MKKLYLNFQLLSLEILEVNLIFANKKAGRPVFKNNLYICIDKTYHRLADVVKTTKKIVYCTLNFLKKTNEYLKCILLCKTSGELCLTAPHQPRLDWQMWFAALGTYHQNAWLMSLTYRILTGQPEVLSLMDQAHNPFKDAPPKYLRANLYHYHYSTWSQR